MFCNRCQKQVVTYAVSSGAAPREELDRALSDMRRKWESEGKLVLFNPPPMGPFYCPECGEQLSRQR